MKKTIILLIAMTTLLLSTSSAQKKGDMCVGGNLKLAISTSGSNGYTSTGSYLSIAPEFGYFISDRVKVGCGIGYEVSSNAHVVALTPNIVYYHPIIDKLYYTPHINIGGALGVYSGYEAGIFTLSLELASFEYRPTENLGISTCLVNLSYSLVDKTNNINFSVLYSPAIGFHYYF